MKKLNMLGALLLVISLLLCGISASAEEPAVMTYSDYEAAELDSPVCVETYVQNTQSWYEGKISVYAQSPDGAYFIYNMTCSEEDSAKLVPGTKILVKGFKSEWSGEVEITDATFEFAEGDAFTAEAEDVTAKIGAEDLIKEQNKLVVFKGMTIEAQEDGSAFTYKDAEGKTDDLYFKASKDGTTVDFCVEFYLCGKDTDVYKAVEGLKVGDVVDITAYLYWYNGANPHVIAVAAGEAGEQPAAPSGEVTELTGKWQLIKSEGGSSAQELQGTLDTLKQANGGMYMTFKEGKLILTITVQNQSQDSETTYEIKDGKFCSEGSVMDIELNGDSLKLLENGNILTLTKVSD